MTRITAKRFRTKIRRVEGVVWTGDLKDLPKEYRVGTSTLTGKIEVVYRGAVMKRGTLIHGLRKGDWMLRDKDGNMEVISEDRLKTEYSEDEGEEDGRSG